MLAATALIAQPAGPAGADPPSVTVVFTTPAGQGAVLTGSPVTLVGTVSTSSGEVDAIELTVERSDHSGPPPQQVTLTPGTPGPTFAWSWTPTLASNGFYTLEAVAVTSAGNGSPQTLTTAGVIFNVNDAPSAPAGLTATIDATGAVTLSWAPNGEPDLTGYLILRAGPGGAARFAPIAEVAPRSTTYTDRGTAAAGTYRYAVVALRWNSTGTVPDPSPQSSPVSVTVAGAPASAPAPAAPKGWGPAPTVAARPGSGAPPAAGVAPAGPATTESPAPTESPATTQGPATGAQTSGGTRPATSAGSAPATATGAPAGAAPATTTPAPAPRRTDVISANPKLSSYELLDLALILSVVAMLIAVTREVRRRAAAVETLPAVDVFEEVATGTPMTIGEALARQRPDIEPAPDEPAPDELARDELASPAVVTVGAAAPPVFPTLWLPADEVD